MHASRCPAFWIAVQVADRHLRADLRRDRDRQALSDDRRPTSPAQPDYGPSLPRAGAPAAARARALAARRARAVRCWRWWLAGVAALVIRSEAAVQTYQQTAADARARGLAPRSRSTSTTRASCRCREPDGRLREGRAPLERDARRQLHRRAVRARPAAGARVGVHADRGDRRSSSDAARRYDNFRLLFEGRARVNEVEGYQFAFTARLTAAGSLATPAVRPHRDAAASRTTRATRKPSYPEGQISDAMAW